jgi:hypothetical protein
MFALKMFIGFIVGIVVCSLFLFGVRSVLPIRAETDNLSEASDNLTQGLTDLLPDIEGIYKEALTMPFRKAESKIYDEDIAQYYRELVNNTVLREPGSGTN